jgi:hypothetical protein
MTGPSELSDDMKEWFRGLPKGNKPNYPVYPYSITIPRQLEEGVEPEYPGHGWDDSIAWVRQHMGQRGVDWQYRGMGQFQFMEEKNYIMFLLRWA